MLDNPARRCSPTITPSLRSHAALVAHVNVWSTPANRPPLEPGASCTDGRQVSRGHTNGHTHELRGCNHVGHREFMGWGRHNRVSPPLTPQTAHFRGCPARHRAPAKLRNRKLKATCPTTHLSSSAGVWAQLPCTTPSYSSASAPESLAPRHLIPAQVPLNLSPFTQITLTRCRRRRAPAPRCLRWRPG